MAAQREVGGELCGCCEQFDGVALVIGLAAIRQRGCRVAGTARSLAGEGARRPLLQRERSAYNVVAGRSVHVPKRDGRRGRRDRHEPRRACVPSSLSIVRKRAGLGHK
ncbi:hypothetical protein DFH09DRAFT_1290810, partial [Mycena vulgaris]